jgi:hypothetical protein
MSDELSIIDTQGKNIARPVTPPMKMDNPIDSLISLAISKDLDIDKLERLMQMKASEEEKTAKSLFDAAMSRVQAKIQPIIADAENAHTGSRYAKLETIVRALSPHYTAEGFSVSYTTGECASQRLIDAGWFRTIATLSHIGGYEKTYPVDLPADTVGSGGKVNKTMIHATKSTITYARVILLGMMFNFTTSLDVDDDGNAGGSQTITQEQAATMRDELSTIDDKAESDFCKYMKVEALEDIPAKKLVAANNAILATKKSAQK